MEPHPPSAPYPGLRPFVATDAELFCGRSEHRIELLEQLEDSKLLAVVGSSGSGKSSLVHAGLLPDIEAGRLIRAAGRACHYLSMRPSNHPFGELAAALHEWSELSGALSPAPDRTEIEETLRRGPFGLVNFFERIEPGEGEPPCFFVVVDQFEELFRFASAADQKRDILGGAHNEAQAFVNLLMKATEEAQKKVDLSIVLTMRSDFVRDCEQFEGLPEAISSSQFLTPRLTRLQLAEAIERPLRLYNGGIDEDLIHLILNELAPEQDQLPVLQHLLAQMWTVASAGKAAGGQVQLTAEHYQAVGTLENAMAWQRVQAFAGFGDDLGDDGEVDRIFRCLAEFDHAGRLIRRPRSVGDIAAESGLSQEQVIAIAEVARADGYHFLMPPAPKKGEAGAEDKLAAGLARIRRVALDADTVLDLTHESLIRKWPKYRQVMEVERGKRDAFRRIREIMPTAERRRGLRLGLNIFKWMATIENLMPTWMLKEAHEKLLSGPPPTEAWIRRYAGAEGGSWDETRDFILAAGRRAKALVLVVASLMVLAASTLIAIAIISNGRARDRQDKLAVEQEKLAAEQEKFAVEEKARQDAEKHAKQLEQEKTAKADALELAQAAQENLQRLQSSQIAVGVFTDIMAEELSLSIRSWNFDPDWPESIRLDVARRVGDADPVVIDEVLDLLKAATAGIEREGVSAPDPVEPTVALIGPFIGPAGGGSAHPDGVNEIAFASSTELLSWGADKRQNLWNIQRGYPKLKASVLGSSTGGGLTAGDFGWTAKRQLWTVTGSSGRSIRVFLLQDDELEQVSEFEALDGHRDAITSINCIGPSLLYPRYVGEGWKMISTSMDAAAPALLWSGRLTDPKGAERTRLIGPKAAVTSSQFSPTGDLVLLSARDERAWLFSTSTGRALIAAGDGSSVRRAIFRPDYVIPEFITLGRSSELLWWRASGRDSLEQRQGRPKEEAIRSTLLDKPIGTWEGHRAPIVAADFSAPNSDGTLLATGDASGRVMVWSIKRGADIGRQPDPGQLTTLSYPAGSDPPPRILTLDWSPDSTLLAAGADDGRVFYWRLERGRDLASIGAGELIGSHDGPVWQVAFNPDGSLLASAGGYPAIDAASLPKPVERKPGTLRPDGKILLFSVSKD